MADFLAVQSVRPDLRLVPPLIRQFGRPRSYIPEDGLPQAMDAAMLIGIPLLLTGEPGTGKTSAARWLAEQLGARMLTFDVKSTTGGRDLLYSFDEVGRFRDHDDGKPKPLIEYIQFNALGEAIIRAGGGGASLGSIKPAVETASRAFGIKSADAMIAANLLPGDSVFAKAPPEHCVVLIDELDKAPRDTPNDLLAEIDRMAFTIPELGIRVGDLPVAHSQSAVPEPAVGLRPIVVITSNSEKGLPEAFLRRCAYFDIPAPGKDRLAAIIAGVFPAIDAKSEIFGKAHGFYSRLRQADWVRKKPGTAELLAWIGCLVMAPDSDPARFDRTVARASLGCVLKSAEDLKEGTALFDDWQR